MWHKLREIFGYKDSRRQRHEVTDNSVDENVGENNTMKGSFENSDEMSARVTSGFNESLVENSDTSLYTKYKERFASEDCFECKVTTSVLLLLFTAHICRSIWKHRVNLPPSKQKYVLIGNISLLGFWLALMKREWYDEKPETGAPKSLDLSALDKFMRYRTPDSSDVPQK